MSTRASTLRLAVGTILVSILAAVTGVLVKHWMGGRWGGPVATAVFGSVLCSVLVLVLSPRWGRAQSTPPCRAAASTSREPA